MVSTTVALLCCCIAVVFFGSNFVPVKTVETGDGVFFSWVLCSGIFFVGVIVNFAEGFPPFEPWAMLGGAIWCTGNLMSVPTIKLIGLSLGMLLWGTTNMLFGWATDVSAYLALSHSYPAAQKARTRTAASTILG